MAPFNREEAATVSKDSPQGQIPHPVAGRLLHPFRKYPIGLPQAALACSGPFVLSFNFEIACVAIAEADEQTICRERRETLAHG